MSKTTDEFYKFMYRLHNCKPCVNNIGQLPTIEFLLLQIIATATGESKSAQEICNCETQDITLKDICSYTGMTMSAVSKKITILERKKLVVRKASEIDKRVANLYLTPEGIELLKSEQIKRHEWLLTLIDKMGEEKMNDLIALSNEVFDIVEDMKAQKKGQNKHD